MEHQRNPLLTWAYYCQGKSIDELRQYLLLTTVELETLRARAHEELVMRDDELNHLKNLLSLAMRARDDAHEKCEKLIFEKLLLQQQQQLQSSQFPPIESNQTAPLSGSSSIEDESIKEMDSNNNNNIDFSSSETEESAFTSPHLAAPPDFDEELDPLLLKRPLPEQGKLLEAVMKSGPLLQTLLLAGPLPQWRHPPPPIQSYQIPPPPVVVFDNGSGINRKRGGIFEGVDVYPTQTKYQKVFPH